MLQLTLIIVEQENSGIHVLEFLILEGLSLCAKSY